MGSILRELLFFDTFSHEFSEDINLDLVQFPKPVYITEVRIIPLGAKVQADFPGGVRLGATNPSKFGIEFFVNDLGKPGASTFENLGQLNYNQNDCINLECENDKIPTDGLVLRGWYTTITLAVYGTLTKHLTEQIASPPPPVDASPEEVSLVPVQITTGGDPIVKEQKIDWPDEVPNPAVDVAIFEPEVYVEPVVFDGTVFEQTATPTIATAAPQYADDCFLTAVESSRDVEKRPIARRKSRSSERSSSRNRTYSHSDSNDREYNSRSKREWSRSPEYRHARRIRRDRSREDRDHIERDHKRPRTPPPAQQLPGSPRRPRSPAPEHLAEQFADVGEDSDYKYRQKSAKASGQPIRVIGSDQAPKSPATIVEPADESQPQQPIDDETMSQDEQFEPILSDEEIGDDNEEPENEDLEMEDNDVEDAIKHFDPFKMRLQRYEMDLSSSCFRDSEILVKVLRKYEIQTQTNSMEDFLNSSPDEKENFVILSEQLMSHLQQISMSSLHRRNYILEKTFEEQSEHLKLAVSVLKVALDFECACSQPQPGYKVRHIKIGARLAELLCISMEFLDYFITIEGCDPFKSLFDLYEKEYMALSIKLLLLKAIYSILDTKLGVNIFLNNKLNGYQRLLTIMNGNPLTRAKFSIKSIIKKVNLFECLEKIRDLVTKQFVLTNHLVDNPFAELEMSLSQTLNAMTKESLSYQQPKRFLPVSEKFELVRDVTAQKSWGHMLHSYFSSHALGESLLLIVSNQMVVPSSILDLTFGLIESLVTSPFGLDYLIYDCFETTELMVKCLLGVEDEQDAAEVEKTGNEDECQVKEKKSKDFPRPLTRGQQLGIEIAFRIQSRFHVDAIKNTKDNVDSLLDHLHALYSQNCSYIGRIYTIESIALNNNIIPFLNLIEKERKAQTQRQQGSPGIKFKSPVLSYAVDLIDSCVRHCTNLEYLIEHGSVLMELVKSHEIFEPAVSAMLQEMAVYLKPLEVVNNFTYDDITQLCEVIKRSIEFITTFPGDLIMGLRILRYLGISSDFGEIRELKYRYVILQFYSADGVVTLVSILEKLNTYFEQPGLHSATLMTTQAVHACQILLPTLEVLREMLTFVIQCRDTQFKDLTAIEHLMKTYCLMHHYPEMSQAFDEAQKVKSEIIKILLAYTQPNPEDEESVHKSLWTQMIREVVKSILSAPSTFIPGLQVLAELLPLPLPVQTLQPLSGTETHRLMTERKLWSAHLHPESANLTDLIQTICPSTFPQLKDLLTRVCLQLADLAPNMTLLVSKSVIDMILNDSSTTGTAPGSAGLARLLQFLGQLTAYASVKISSLSIFSGRLYEFFNQILSNNDTSETHQQCQKNVHRIYENFFDSEISMIAPNSTGSAELNLACALPSKELISGIAGAVAANLMNSPIGGPVSIAASRNLIILTEHDITFYYLKVALEAKKDLFQDWLQKLAELQEKEPHSGLFGTIVIFFRALLFIDDSSPDTTLPIRTMKLSASQLAAIVGWTNDPEKPHMLQRMAKVLSDEAEPRNEELLQDFSNLIACLQSAAESIETDEKLEFAEPLLPQAEGIVTQYLSRPIFTLFETSDEAQLSASYWLDPIRLDSSASSDEINLQNERVAKDLAEMVETCLPPDTNLSSDCKRILHLSASPQSNRERTTTAPCFRTRRVEVEPSTGRPEKKIFVTPMRGRGFPRTPPSRGDLFRSRPPNTSRPPSLHVDDFLALETCGAQPTGPTGYNKLSRDIINIRGTRGGRGRGNRMSSGGSYRNLNPSRTNSPNTWSHVDSSGGPPPQHFRTATSEPVVTPSFVNDSHYGQPHFGGAPIRSRGRGRLRTFLR